MAKLTSAEILEHVRGAMLRLDGAEPADRVLLDAFIDHRSDEAFETLVRRHGPMVLGVCRRVIGDRHEAEDAFQATFLVLVRKARSVVPREMVGNWLYGVAYHTAIKARAVQAKRHRREQLRTKMPEPEAPASKAWDDLQPLLDQELSRLPDKYRVPIVLVDLEGKTRKEAAQQLGWPEGSVSSRLSRARELLARRLTSRGLTLSSSGLAAVCAANSVSATVPASLVVSTIKAASIFAASSGTTGLISTPIVVLTESVIRAMFLTKVKFTVMALMVVGLMIGTTSLGIRSIPGSAFGQQPKEIAKEDHRKKPIEDSNATVKGKNPKELKEAEDKIRALLQERLKTAQKYLDILKAKYDARGADAPGYIDTKEMQQAYLLVHKAELDACETDKECVTVHEKYVKQMMDHERRAQLIYVAGRGAESDLLAAKMYRMEAEIALERAKAKLTAAEK